MLKHLVGLAAICLPALAAAAPSGIELQNFDETVSPGSDFYRHVNGRWLDTTKIPADKSNYGAFSVIADRTELQLQAIIKEAAAGQAEPGSAAQRIGDLYNSFMNEARANALGLAPLDADLLLIERLNTHSELPQLLAALEQIGGQALFNGWIGQDKKDPQRYTVYLYQGGLSLPDRDFYLTDSEKFASLRRAYADYASRMLQLAGTVDAPRYAQAILALETRIASVHWSKVDNRDAEKTYNPAALSTLNDKAPHFDLSGYLRDVGVRRINEVVLYQPSFFAEIGAILNDTPIDVLREYFRLHLLNRYAPYLSQPFVDLQFGFFGATLNGITENRPRWKRGVGAVEDMLGELLGQLYVERHFPPEAKTRMQALVKQLIAAYRQSIQELDWMSPATKKEALKKLAAFTPKIGYPDKWKDYSAIDIRPDDLVGNVRRSTLVEVRRELAKLGQPVDRTEWHMTPQTVNAYYNPPANEIVFPAAILQAPFFDLNADDAVNYGGIGGVIGHEIGHGFDDQGSRYDGEGRLRNWWTDEDRERFEKRTHQLIEQYGAYEPLPGHHVNGELTIGENIGDLGGLSIAAKAYTMSLQGKEAPVIDGYTGMQRVLIGWAQIWRRLYREEALINRLKTDPHSPGVYRCNGIVSNLPEFYDSFDVKPTDPMWLAPEKRVKIW